MFFDHVVVSVDHIEPVVLIKPGQLPEYVTMDFFDLFHIPVFPEFVSISQFNVGVAALIIIVQSGEIEMAVFQKIVALGTASPVTVTEKHITAPGFQRKNGNIAKGFI